MSISRNRSYGVSSKFQFGYWSHRVVGPFSTEEEAQKWLYCEEYDFRERELMSKSAVIRLVGRKEFLRQVSAADVMG